MKNRLFFLLTCLIFSTSSASALNAGGPTEPVLPASTVEILNPDTINICQGDTVFFQQTNDANDEGLLWRTTDGFLDEATNPAPRAIPMVSRYYVVQVGPEGMVDVDSVYVDVDVFVRPQLIDSGLYCQNTALPLLQQPITDRGNTNYDFTPGLLLADSTDPNTIYFPAEFIDTTFTLISSVDNGACADTQEVRIDLIEAVLDLGQEDTLDLCLGSGLETLSVEVQPESDVEVTWTPSTFVVGSTTGRSIRVEPLGDVEYFVSAVVNGCPLMDSVTVRIDSLPENTEMTIDPEKDPFCQGDTFSITSPVYDVGDFPLITHRWDVAPGLESPEDLYNGVFFASDSALMTRVTTNGGCSRTDTLQVNVIKPPILIFDPDPAVVCPGEPLQITVSFSPEGPRGTLEWEDPRNTLSCTDCLTPVATVNQNETYTIEVTSEGSDCSMPVDYMVSIQNDPQPQLTSATSLCSGDSRPIIIGGLVDGYTYRITGPGVDTNDPDVTVTPMNDGETYTIETTGICGTQTQQLTFNFVDGYTLSVEETQAVCEGESVILTATLSDETNGTFTWTLPDGTTQTGNQLEVSPAQSGTYSVTFADAFGCGSLTETTEVVVVGTDFDLDVIAVTANDVVRLDRDTVFAGERLTLTAVNIPAGLNVTYEWSGNFDPGTGDGPELTVTAPREDGRDLDYTLTVRTVDGNCPLMDDILLTYVEAQVEIPELITPNGDGINDEFRLYYGGNISNYELKIFNRWGQRVFESSDVDQAWDGTRNGTPQTTDMYLYLAKFTINGLEVTREGEFQLVR